MTIHTPSITNYPLQQHLDESMMLCKEDVDKPGNALFYYKKGKTVPFQISTYEEKTNKDTGELFYKITGIPINLDGCETVLVRFFIDKVTFDKADFTQVFVATITSAIRNGDHVTLLVGDVHPVEYKTTLNDTIVTRDHYEALNFPNTCDDCMGVIYWSTLALSEVKFEYGVVTKCVCGRCTGRKK